MNEATQKIYGTINTQAAYSSRYQDEKKGRQDKKIYVTTQAAWVMLQSSDQVI